MDNTEFILQKITKMASKKNFFGVTKKDLLSAIKNIDMENFDILVEENKVKTFQNRFFPADWQPALSPIEENIIEFITPCLKKLSKVEFSKIKSKFYYVNEESVALLLNKMEYLNKIIKIDKKLYLFKEDFNNYIKIANDLKTFTIKEFKDTTELRRESALALLTKFDAEGITIFDGTQREIT